MRTAHHIPTWLITVALLSISSFARAQKTDADQPLDIRARNVDLDEKTGVAVYRGNVVLTQGSMNIHADRLELTRVDGKLSRLDARGAPAQLTMTTDAGEVVRASARRIEYRANARQLELHDSVELHRDADVFHGAIIHYDLTAEAFHAEGGPDGRAHAVIQPPRRSTP